MTILEKTSSLLSGIRVIDLSRVLAGPFMTMVLGDMGADVIKIEKPIDGDDTRSWGPPFCGNESAYFLSVNRNKRSVVVDLKRKEGVKIITDLVKDSDVFVENYVPGKMDKFGLGYDKLKKINPGLVYCSISGFGPEGPYAHRPGYDVIAASYGGLNYITGPEDGEPCKSGVAMTDLCTGLYGQGAILAALMKKRETGLGQKIDCDLLSSQIATLVNISSSYLNAGIEAKRWGTAHASIVPYQSFKTKDGKYVTVGATTNKQFNDLCDKMKLEHVSTDPRFADNAKRVKNRESLLPILKKSFLDKDCEDWLFIFEDSTFPYGPVNNMEQVFSDPHVLHTNRVLEFDHPTAGKGCKVTAPAVKFSNYEYPKILPPPTLGQHTKEVLRDLLDMSEFEIDKLTRNGVVT
uniref:succinate--hydroxymethylglutarate CoA-transferase-like n=1 Tax=Styela clava TaxID=7725 RepID=UPI001939C794|nr:succinate--hydroxymethylglutarate CoA-transferase-like [Styela clava]